MTPHYSLRPRPPLPAARHHRGQAMTEFALVVLLLLGSLVATLEGARLLISAVALANAAAEGARAGAFVPTSTQTVSALDASIRTAARGTTAFLGIIPDDDINAEILQEMTSAAAAGIPPFPAPAILPAWPSGDGNSLTAYYLLTDGTGLLTQGVAVGSGSIPPAAAGVRVELRLRASTLFAQVLGPCCQTVKSFASARAVLRPLGNTDTGSPFIVCGGGSTAGTDGAWVVASAIPSHIGTRQRILDGSTSPARIDPSYVGDTLRVHDPGGQFQIVTWAPFKVVQAANMSDDAVLLGAAMVDGQALDTPFNPSAPGAFTIKLAPDF